MPCLIQGAFIPASSAPHQNELYQTLKTIETDQSIKAITALHQLLKKQSQNETLIHLLLTLALKEGNIDSVFSETALCSINLLPALQAWIEAKIALYHDDPESAFDAYKRALKQDTIGIYMLQDYCQFLSRYPKAFSHDSIVHTMDNDTLLFKSFNFYESEQWAQALSCLLEACVSTSPPG